MRPNISMNQDPESVEFPFEGDGVTTEIAIWNEFAEDYIFVEIERLHGGFLEKIKSLSRVSCIFTKAN